MSDSKNKLLLLGRPLRENYCVISVRQRSRVILQPNRKRATINIVRTIMTSFMAFFLFILTVSISFAAGVGGERNIKKEAASRLKRHEQRYDDYFARKKKIRGWHKTRASGRDAQRLHRQLQIEKHEKVRQKYIGQREFKVIEKWNEPETYDKYLESVKSRKKQHILSRKIFIQRQQALADKINRGHKRLTDKQDYGVEFDADRTDKH